MFFQHYERTYLSLPTHLPGPLLNSSKVQNVVFKHQKTLQNYNISGLMLMRWNRNVLAPKTMNRPALLERLDGLMESGNNGPRKQCQPSEITLSSAQSKKNGDKPECTNYRGISLLVAFYKILLSILFGRLKAYMTFNIGQSNWPGKKDQGSEIALVKKCWMNDSWPQKRRSLS